MDKFAFVLMPFAKEFDDVYKLGIKEPAKALGFKAERVDEQIYSEGMLERIYRQIELADVVIADMSGQNPNVFYEVGYAHAKEKLCIHLTREAKDIPFDLKLRRHIVYGTSIQILRAEIAKALAWVGSEIENVKKSRIKVPPPKIRADLIADELFATAKLQFKIDLRNESSKASPEIEAVYFYSGEGWTMSQEDRECPQTESDIPGYHTRHFLSCPVKRLPKGAWTQIAFIGRKVMALKWRGDEVKDSYSVRGRAILRLVAAEENFDYEVPIDVNASNSEGSAAP